MTLHSLDHFHEFARHRGAENEIPGDRESVDNLAILVVLGPVAAIGAFSLLSLLA